ATASIDDTAGTGDQLTIVGTDGNDLMSVNLNRIDVGSRVYLYDGIETLRLAGLVGSDRLNVLDSDAQTVILDGGVGSDTYQVFEGASNAFNRIHDSGPASDGTSNIDRLNVAETSKSVAVNTTFSVGSMTVLFDETIERVGREVVSPVQIINLTNGIDFVELDGLELRVNGQVIDLTGVVDLTVNAFDGEDVFVVIDVSPTLVKVVFDGGEGNDLLYGPDLDATWTLSGANSGKLSGDDTPIDFASVENLTGGADRDTFLFSNDGAPITGTLSGGDRTDTLHYSARSVAVTVHLGS
ncbi:MAG: hypothetical protein ACK43N_02890, partial [Pirellulaceae bacterium]